MASSPCVRAPSAFIILYPWSMKGRIALEPLTVWIRHSPGRFPQVSVAHCIKPQHDTIHDTLKGKPRAKLRINLSSLPFPTSSLQLLCYLWFAAAAAAQSLQSCPTLCNPIDGSPPGSPVPGILRARTLEWVAISFSNA